jgi:hypothetical protein
MKLMRLLCCGVMLWLGLSAIAPSTSIAVASPITQAQLDEITTQWQGSTHALADVNCSSCHQNEETKDFVQAPGYESCQSCHEPETETFLLGKHGIRLQEGMSPLTPALARLPMHEDVGDRVLNCNTCHDVHALQTRTAAVDSCLTCHNDTHSQNYRNSPHATLFSDAGELPRPESTAVTCATCHLPRQTVGETDAVFVNHNNTYTLLPRDRMVKDVCMNCHGLEHSYNSIFDDDLVEANFAQMPTQTMETFELIRAFEAQRSSQNTPEPTEE